MSEEKKKSKWPIFVGVAVVALTVKTFLPDVWTRVGEEIQPVISPAFDKDQESAPGQSTNSEDSELPAEEEQDLLFESTDPKPLDEFLGNSWSN